MLVHFVADLARSSALPSNLYASLERVSGESLDFIVAFSMKALRSGGPTRDYCYGDPVRERGREGYKDIFCRYNARIARRGRSSNNTRATS